MYICTLRDHEQLWTYDYLAPGIILFLQGDEVNGGDGDGGGAGSNNITAHVRV